jgi:hypothetical protein
MTGVVLLAVLQQGSQRKSRSGWTGGEAELQRRARPSLEGLPSLSIFVYTKIKEKAWVYQANG